MIDERKPNQGKKTNDSKKLKEKLGFKKRKR
jgi:hypothetical protein